MDARKNIPLLAFLLVLSSSLFSFHSPSVIAASDIYEPNDDFNHATIVTRGMSIYASIDPSTDVDYYRVYLSAGENLSVLLWNLTADLDLYLYDPSHYSIGYSSYGGIMNETVAIGSASVAGYYFIRVFGYGGSTSNYSLDIGFLPDDIYEPNNSFAQAATLSKAVTYSNLCLANVDYFKIFLNAGQNLSVSMTRSTLGTGYFDLYLYAPDFSIIHALNSIYIYGPGANTYTANVATTGYYYIKVSPSDSSSWGNYSLILNDIFDDSFESNDNFNNATLLSKTTYSNLQLYNDDFYKIYLNQNSSLMVYLERNSLNAGDDFELSLFAPDTTTLLVQEPNIYMYSSYTTYFLNVASSGFYYIWVHQQYSNSFGSYSLTLADAKDDSYEPNDNFTTATLLSRSSTYQNLALFNDDYFRLSLSAGESLKVTLTRSSYNYGSPLEIRLYGPDTTTLLDTFSGSSGSTGDVFVKAAKTTGFYYIQVVCVPSAQNWGNYSLSFSDVIDDTYEPNNDIHSARPLAKLRWYNDAQLYDEDYYSVHLNTGEGLRFLVVRQTGSRGACDISIYAPDMVTVVASATGVTVRGDLTIKTANTTGNYYIRIMWKPGVEGAYNIYVGDPIDTSTPLNPFVLWGCVGGIAAAAIVVTIVVIKRRRGTKSKAPPITEDGELDFDD